MSGDTNRITRFPKPRVSRAMTVPVVTASAGIGGIIFPDTLSVRVGKVTDAQFISQNLFVS